MDSKTRIQIATLIAPKIAQTIPRLVVPYGHRATFYRANALNGIAMKGKRSLSLHLRRRNPDPFDPRQFYAEFRLLLADDAPRGWLTCQHGPRKAGGYMSLLPPHRAFVYPVAGDWSEYQSWCASGAPESPEEWVSALEAILDRGVARLNGALASRLAVTGTGTVAA